MLYQVKRFRLMAALKVGALGGLIVGALGGFAIMPLFLFYRFVQVMFLNDFLPPLSIVTDNLDKIGGLLIFSIGMAIIGAIGGVIAGAIIMGVLGFFYNFTTRYTGGLMVELEARGKLKEHAANSSYAHEEMRSARPLALDELLDDEDESEPLEAGIRTNKASAVRRQST
jgi:hypothetical protein